MPNAELYEYWKRGEYHPYSDDTLIDLVARCKALVPPYCRVNQVYRDIPATNIVAGSTLSNLRQAVASHMREQGSQCRCIRCREVRGELIFDALTLNDYVYETRHAQEHFLSFDTAAGRLAGYLRLSLPQNPPFVGIPELVDAALVREVHVYGQAQQLGQQNSGRMQHSGLGTRLLRHPKRRRKPLAIPNWPSFQRLAPAPIMPGEVTNCTVVIWSKCCSNGLYTESLAKHKNNLCLPLIVRYKSGTLVAYVRLGWFKLGSSLNYSCKVAI